MEGEKTMWNILLIIFAIIFVSNGQWFPAIRTDTDSSKFYYSGSVYSEVAPVNHPGEGQLFAEYFDKQVAEVRITMNGFTDLVVLVDTAVGKTLNELASTSTVNTYYADPTVDTHCTQNSPWNLTRVPPEHLTCYHPNGPGHTFVFNGHDFFSNVRMGIFADNTCTPCSQSGSPEGFALNTITGRDTASGQMQISVQNTFTFVAGLVEVFCLTTTPAPIPVSAFGDPHFRSLDGLNFDYNGPCNYMVLTNDCVNKEEKYPKFEMIGRHGKCSSYDKKNMCITRLSINIWEKKNSVPVRIDLESNDQMKINDIKVKLPYVSLLFNASLIVRSMTNKRIHVVTNFGLHVWYADYGSGTLEVNAGKLKTCGLLGNNNNDPTDDLLMKNGEILPHSKPVNEALSTQFGDSWMVATPHQPLRCRLHPTNSYESSRHCSFDQVSVEKSCEKMLKTQLHSLSGKAVAKCFSSSKENEIDGKRIFNDCVAEICACQKKRDECQPNVAMEEFQRVCVENDVPFPDISWN